MKNFIKVLFCSVLCLSLVACTQVESQKTATAVSPIAIVPSSTIVPASATLNPSLPTVSFNSTPVIGTSGSQTPSPNQLPDFEPTQIPGVLKSALTIETLSSFNGYGLQRISGWKHGFYSFEWLDTNHLMLYPFAGMTSFLDTMIAGTYPAVVNINTKKFWIPNLSQAVVRNRASFSWSAQLGALILPGQNNEVFIYNPEGELRNTYEGSLLGVSPSGTKILLDGGIWIDLSNGKTIDFAWNQTYPAADYATNVYSHHSFPIWSSDETRVYACCYLYGDAKTGASLMMPYDGITIDGEKVNDTFEAFRGTWVLNNQYLLPIWEGVWDGRYSAILLFDPATKTYRNLSKIVGLPDYFGYDPEPYCNRPSAQNGGRYIWVACRDGGHLIDLVTFHSQIYLPIDVTSDWLLFADVEWSADGKFIWLHGDRDGIERILSVTGKELKPLPQNCSDFEWHPKDNTLICLSNDNKSILLVDAKTLNETILTTEFWVLGLSSDGKHVALLARDHNSLWQADYPKLENLKQLTPPMPELAHLVKNVAWSPDESAIAFMGAQDIYIVQTDSKP